MNWSSVPYETQDD